ncbi:MAG: hypothetical protein SPL80_02810 [Bacilli bacterium]|nr:hypothetical protein [Bacilli bacterium]
MTPYFVVPRLGMDEGAAEDIEAKEEEKRRADDDDGTMAKV